LPGDPHPLEIINTAKWENQLMTNEWSYNRHSRRTALKLMAAGAATAAMARFPAMAAITVSDAAKAEGEVVIATAGGMLQDALAKHLYDGFTKATGIKVTPVTINPDEQWAKVKADTEGKNVQWDLVNVGPDSMTLQKDYLYDMGAKCENIPNLATNGAEGVCQQMGFSTSSAATSSASTPRPSRTADRRIRLSSSTPRSSPGHAPWRPTNQSTT
jgi:hypothetical protein